MDSFDHMRQTMDRIRRIEQEQIEKAHEEHLEDRERLARLESKLDLILKILQRSDE